MQIVSSLNCRRFVSLAEDHILKNYCGLAGGKTTPTVFMGIKPEALSGVFCKWIEDVFKVRDGREIFHEPTNDWGATLNVYSDGSRVKCAIVLGGVVNGVVKQSQPLDVYLNQQESILVDNYSYLIYQSYANGSATKIAG